MKKDIARDDSVRIFFSTGKVSLVKEKKINKSYILYIGQVSLVKSLENSQILTDRQT